MQSCPINTVALLFLGKRAKIDPVNYTGTELFRRPVAHSGHDQQDHFQRQKGNSKWV